MLDLNSFAARLRSARKTAGFNQDELAARVRVSEKTIVNYEGGHTEPAVPLLCALADALDVSADWLLGRTDNPRMPAPGLVVVDLDEIDAPKGRARYAATIPPRFRIVTKDEHVRMRETAVAKLKLKGEER